MSAKKGAEEEKVLPRRLRVQHFNLWPRIRREEEEVEVEARREGTKRKGRQATHTVLHLWMKTQTTAFQWGCAHLSASEETEVLILWMVCEVTKPMSL